MKLKILKVQNIINPEIGFHFARHVRFSVTTDAHCHQGFAEIFLVAKGSFGHSLNGIESTINENRLFFVRPQDVHYYFRADSNSQMGTFELLNLAFSLRTLELALEYFGDAGLSEKILSGKQQVWAELSKDRKMAIAQSLIEAGLCASSYPRQASCKFRQVLLELLSCFNNPVIPTTDGSVAPTWLNLLCAEFESKMNFRKGIDFLVRKSGYSHEHLCRVFKDSLGITPTDYINRLKLEYVASMLIVSDEQISCVAVNAGFENLSHFNHLFRKCYGVSPSYYRKSKSFLMQ